MARRKHDRGPTGETFEAFLKEQGIGDEVYTQALEAVRAWQLDEERKRQKPSKG